MADVDLTYINAAASRTGSETITELTDGSLIGKIAAQSYEPLVRSELSLMPWKQASKIAVLDRIDPTTMGDPPEPWTAAYELPTDLIDIRTVMVAGLPITYAVHGNTILCDADSSSDVILHYVWRVPENRWHPAFAEGITKRLEAMFLRGKEQYAEAEKRDAAAALQFAKARHRDTVQQTSRAVVKTPTLDARRG